MEPATPGLAIVVEVQRRVDELHRFVADYIVESGRTDLYLVRFHSVPSTLVH